MILKQVSTNMCYEHFGMEKIHFPSFTSCSITSEMTGHTSEIISENTAFATEITVGH